MIVAIFVFSTAEFRLKNPPEYFPFFLKLGIRAAARPVPMGGSSFALLAPCSLRPSGFQDFLARQAGVTSVHDLHVWAMRTTENALSAHIVIPNITDQDKILSERGEELHEQFEILYQCHQGNGF